MSYGPELHQRRWIRLKDFDYSSPGGYFITFNVRQGKCLLGEIEAGVMYPNVCGEAVQFVWDNLPSHYPDLEPDAFAVMPNHVHAILMVGSLKSFSARRVNQLRGVKGVPVWQEDYFETISRDETELTAIREYIIRNPPNWETDSENLLRTV